MTDEPQQQNDLQEAKALPSQSLVPPTPVTPEWAHQQPMSRRKEIGKGILYGVLIHLVSAAIGAYIGSYSILILLLSDGIVITRAYRAKRPNLAFGVFISIGIAISIVILLILAFFLTL